jgi:hypothetical protein
MDERPQDGSSDAFLLGGMPILAACAENSNPRTSKRLSKGSFFRKVFLH